MDLDEVSWHGDGDTLSKDNFAEDIGDFGPWQQNNIDQLKYLQDRVELSPIVRIRTRDQKPEMRTSFYNESQKNSKPKLLCFQKINRNKNAFTNISQNNKINDSKCSETCTAKTSANHFIQSPKPIEGMSSLEIKEIAKRLANSFTEPSEVNSRKLHLNQQANVKSSPKNKSIPRRYISFEAENSAIVDNQDVKFYVFQKNLKARMCKKPNNYYNLHPKVTSPPVSKNPNYRISLSPGMQSKNRLQAMVTKIANPRGAIKLSSIGKQRSLSNSYPLLS